jgi:hypothetical protein
MNICRVCKGWDRQESMVKYATRHTAHGDCLIRRWGWEILDKLTPYQLMKLPFVELQKHDGLLDAVKQRVHFWEVTK